MEMPKKNDNVPPLSKKVEVLKKKNCMLRLLTCTIKTNVLSMNIRRRKKNSSSFDVTPPTSIVMVTVHKYLVMKKVLNLCIQVQRKKHCINRVWNFIWFPMSIGGPGICPQWLRGTTVYIIAFNHHVHFMKQIHYSYFKDEIRSLKSLKFCSGRQQVKWQELYSIQFNPSPWF